MNAELIHQLTEYADNPGYSHGDYADTMRQAAAALSERATQPAQRKSQIDIHRITCEEARKIGGGLIDKIPADDVTALGRAIYQRILDSAPAQDQVAAARAVPDNINQFIYKLINEHFNYGTVYGEDAKQHYAAAVEIAEFAAELLYGAAPSPQPEMNGSICPMKTPAIPDEGANEFIELMADWRHAELGSDSTAAFDAMVKFIDAWKDVACAMARDDAKLEMRAAMTEATHCAADWKQRATDAETKLEAIQSQAAGDKPTGCTHNCNQGRHCTCR